MSSEQRNGAIVIAIGLVLLAVAFTDHVPFLSGGGGRTVTAQFAEASQVDTATPVRVHGVDVGTVSALKPAPGNTTTVAMSLTTSGVKLYRDASAEIRWRTLLGGSMYIDLQPGSSNEPPLAGEIPLAHTGTQVDWDQFDEMMPTATRPHFQQMLAGFSAGLSAPGQEGHTLHVIGPDVEVVGEGSEALRGSDIGDLPTLIKSTSQVAQSLASDRAALKGLVTGADGTLAATAAHNQSLASAIQLSPPALDSTLITSHTVNATLTALDPLVTRLEPGAKELGPATQVLQPMLKRANTVLDESVPLLHAAPPAISALGTVGSQGGPLIGSLTPLVQRLNGNLLPWLGATDSETRLRLYETIGPLFSALADSLGSFDANGYLYNFNVQVSPGSIELPCDLGPGGTTVSDLAACAAEKSTLARALDGGGR